MTYFRTYSSTSRTPFKLFSTLKPSLLQTGLTVAGLLLAPPVILVLGKGPIVGGKELLGEENWEPADLESTLLYHCFYIDAFKNLVLCALCFAAAFLFEPNARKLTAILILSMDFFALVVQVIAPIGGVDPFPSLDGLTSNPVVLPIIGGQIAMLVAGLLFDGGANGKKKTN